VIRRWPELHDPRAYLYGAIVSGARSWGRRKGRTYALDVPAPIDVDTDAFVVRHALARLPLAQREVLVLRYYVGMTDVEIATTLRLPLGTAKSHLRRGLEAMRKELRTVSTPDDVLDQRLREAMQRIAAEYRASDDVRGIAAAERTDDGRGRWGRRTATAVAVIVALGVAAVWSVVDSPTPRTSHSRAVTSAPQPRFGDSFTVPEVEPMVWEVELNSLLDVGGFERPNRFQAWLGGNDATTRWFVSVEDGRAAATIIVAEVPAWTWSRYEAGERYTDVEGVDGRLDPALNRVAWRHGDVVRSVQVMGSAGDRLAEIVAEAEALGDLADLASPAGFEEVGYRPFTGWQFNASGWEIGVIEPASGEADLQVAAMSPEPDAEPIEGGWLRSDVDEGGNRQRWSAWVRAGDFIVSVKAPGYVDDEVMRDIAGLIEVVPATNRERPLEVWTPGAMVEGQNPVAGGELAWGRWLAVTDAEAEEGRDVHCLAFTGVVEFTGCTEPGSEDLTVCGPSNTTPSRLVMVTTLAQAPESLPVSVEVAGDVLDASVERSGGLTFVTAETDGPRGPLRFVDAAGVELCTG
jgi:hypothetical protein